MVKYGKAQAIAQKVEDRVQFATMDALKTLEFPASYFDLVNQRLGWSFLRTWDWTNLLFAYRRITRDAGTIRITEGDAVCESNSSTLTRLFAIWQDAFYEAGHLFNHEKSGVSSQLERLLQRVGLQNVQTRAYTLEYHGATAEGKQFYENIKLIFQTALPFMQKWSRVPENYEQLVQQALNDMQQPGFFAAWGMVTAWGINQELGLTRDDRR